MMGDANYAKDRAATLAYKKSSMIILQLLYDSDENKDDPFDGDIESWFCGKFTV